MGKVSRLSLIILAVLLSLTAYLAHSTGRATHVSNGRKLHESLQNIPGWRFVGDFPLDHRIAEELNLDDYLFRKYSGEAGVVTLYIGYYDSAKKVGAAHNPLVCFQGQGWQITGRSSGVFRTDRSHNHEISYTSMIVERTTERELIVYWFQANDRALPATHLQKFALLADTLTGGNGSNAFVRISAPVENASEEIVKERILSFIEDFYPIFVGHMMTDKGMKS